MFIGHYGVALAAAAHPRAPRLPVLIAASQLVDLGFFTFMLAGVEHMRIEPGATAMNPMDLYFMPYTHSLLGSAVWALGFALLVGAIMRSAIGGLIAGAVAISHWLLDFVTHRPDLGLLGDFDKVGLGLWDHPAAAMPLEPALVGVGLALYARATRPARPSGRWNLWAFAAALLAMQTIDWFGPKPTRIDATLPLQAIAAYGVAIALAWWVDNARARPTEPRDRRAYRDPSEKLTAADDLGTHHMSAPHARGRARQ